MGGWLHDRTLNEWLGAAQVVAAVVGFFLAWRQLVRTRKATEASAQATKSAIETANRNQLLFVLPQFSTMELEVEFAVLAKNNHGALRVVRTFINLSRQVSAIAIARQMGADRLIEVLARASATATEAKNVLMEAPPSSKDTALYCKEFRKALDEVVTVIVQFEQDLVAVNTLVGSGISSADETNAWIDTEDASAISEGV